MPWDPSIPQSITVPGTAGPNDPRVVVGGGDPALDVLSQPAGVVWYWRNGKAFVMSVEASGATHGQMHLYVVEGGVLSDQVYDIDFDEAANTTAWAIGADVTVSGQLRLGSSTTRDNEENTSQTFAGAAPFAPSGGGFPFACGTDFVAPPSGQVLVLWNAEQVNTGAGFNLTSFEVRAGAIVGAGAVVFAASADRTVRSDGTVVARAGASARVTGLTPGAAYNVQLMSRTNSGTQTVSRRSVIVTPAL